MWLLGIKVDFNSYLFRPLLDQYGIPALGYALKSGNEEIIQTLAKHTTAGLENCVSLLAQSNIKIEGEVSTFVKDMIESFRVRQEETDQAA